MFFYDKEVNVYQKGSIAGKNKIGEVVKNSPVLLKTISVDIQPYSSEQARKDYGFEIECSKVMFCNLGEVGIVENIVEYKDTMYDITKVIEWDDYMEVMLYGKPSRNQGT